MKKTYLFYIPSLLVLILSILLSYSFAQDIDDQILPEGIKLRLGKGRIRNLLFSPDGTQIIVIGNTGITTYDTLTGKFFPKDDGSIDWKIPAALSTETALLAYSPDGTRIAVGLSNGVSIYEAHTGKEMFKLTKKHARINIPPIPSRTDALAYSPDGKTLATTDTNTGTIYLWDAHANLRLGTIPAHTGRISALAFSSDSNMIASGAHGEIRLLDVPNRRKILTFNRYTNKVLAMAFLDDDKILASVDKDGTLRLWDTKNGELQNSYIKHIDSTAARSFSHDGSIIATINLAGNLVVFETSTGREIYSHLTEHIGVVSTLTFSPNGQTFLSGGRDGTIRIWDVATGKMQLGHQVGNTPTNWKLYPRTGVDTFVDGTPSEFIVSTDGSRFAAGISTDTDTTYRVWDTSTGNQIMSITGDYLVDGWKLAISPNGYLLAKGENDGKITVIETTTGQDIFSLSGHPGGIYTLVYSPDNTYLASSGKDGKTLLWDTKTGKISLTLTEEYGSLAFSPNGKILAGAGMDIKLWHIETGLLMIALSRNERMLVRALSFSPNGETLIAAGSGLKAWDVVTGEYVANLSNYFYKNIIGRILAVTFSPDGKTLVTGGWDGILLWQWENTDFWRTSLKRK